ncbi:MAG: DUF3021 domain-containing protein [Methanobrevibacter sp.]|jgi:hypothetical protein|nr:DUF3021 domain-containing protein [Methanobrevibacter sp.]
MNEFLKRTILGALLGNFVFTITIFLNILTKSSFVTSISNNYILFAVVCMFIGVGFTAPSVVYNDSLAMFPKEMSFFRKVLFHMGFGFGFTYLGIFYMMQISNSFDFNDFLGSMLLALFIGCYIWVCFYWAFKSESKRINEKLNYMQNTQKIGEENLSNKDASKRKYKKSYKIFILVANISCFILLLFNIIGNLENLLLTSVTTIFFIILILYAIIGFSDALKKKK